MHFVFHSSFTCVFDMTVFPIAFSVTDNTFQIAA